MKTCRSALALLLASTCCWAQDGIAPITKGWYSVPDIPAARLSNSQRLRSLLQGNKLYLTAQDAIALALENNIDVETNRYNTLIDQWSYIRAQAGGALPGVPSGSSQAGSVQSGEGVAGSQQAGGISGGGSSNSGASNTTISQIGPVTPTLDPTFQSTNSFSHRSAPQANATQSQISNLIDNTRVYQDSISTGFITGGKASLTYQDSYLNENAPSDLLNPQNGTSLTLSFQQNFFYGFGRKLNARNIVIAKRTINIDDLNFQTQVIGVVVSVLNAYYSLVADYQDVKAKREELDVAQRFFEDNKKQVQIGTMAPLDVTTAEAQVASSEQDLVVSETTLEQQQVALKNLLSRNGLADPLLANAEIVPLDRIEVPEKDDAPSPKDALATAMINRVDLKVNDLNLENQKTSNLGTANGVLPHVVAFGTLKTQGLAGDAHAVFAENVQGSGPFTVPPGFIACPSFGPRAICALPEKYFTGGIGTALGQMMRRDFPTQTIGVVASVQMRNRQALADQAIDVMSLRQIELQNERTLNQLAVDVSNQIVGLQQARVRYLAAVKNRVLEQQLLDAEQKKFALGASTTFNVVTQQRDLAAAQATEVATLAAFSQARISLDQILGVTLKNNNVLIQEAQNGQVARQSALPSGLPQ